MLYFFLASLYFLIGVAIGAAAVTMRPEETFIAKVGIFMVMLLLWPIIMALSLGITVGEDRRENP